METSLPPFEFFSRLINTMYNKRSEESILLGFRLEAHTTIFFTSAFLLRFSIFLTIVAIGHAILLHVHVNLI